MKTLPTTRRARQRGIATLEFAILAIPMIILAFGISELGRAIYQYNTLAKATRDAARYLTLFEAGTRDAAGRCLAVYGAVQVDAAGNATCSGTALLPGLALTNAAVAYQSETVTGVGAVNLVTVTLSNYSFRTIVPVVIPDITFGPIHTTMRAPL